MSTLSVLFSLDGASVVAVEGGAVQRVASGLLSVVAVVEGAAELVLLSIAASEGGADGALPLGAFSYPLCGQPIMKSGERLYMLPEAASGTAGTTARTFVLSIGELEHGGASDDDVRTLETLLADNAEFRLRDSHALVEAPAPAAAAAAATVPAPSAAVAATALAAAAVVALPMAASTSAAAPAASIAGPRGGFMGSLMSMGGKLANELSNPASKLRSELLPQATASAKHAAAVIAHEVTDPASVLRTKYVAPVAAAASAAAASVHHEVSNPESRLRAELLPQAQATASHAAAAISNEVGNRESLLRSQLVPAAQAQAAQAAEAVRHEVQDGDSLLNGQIVPSVARELRNPTVAGVGGGIATGLTMAGQGLKSALLMTADAAGRGVVYAAASSTSALGGRTENQVAVSAGTKANIERAKMLTRATVVVTGGMVAGAAAMAKSFGASLSGAFMSTETGRTVVHTATTTDSGRAACRIAASGVGVVADVWAGLEGAARIFGGHTAAATRQVVGDRYGEEARAVASQGLDVCGDLGDLAINLKKLSPAILLGQTANEVTKDFVARAPAADLVPIAPSDASLRDTINAAAAAGASAAASTPQQALELVGSATLLANAANVASVAVLGPASAPVVR